MYANEGDLRILARDERPLKGVEEDDEKRVEILAGRSPNQQLQSANFSPKFLPAQVIRP